MVWTTYKGLQIPDTSSGDAGVNLTADLKLVADGSVYSSSGSPGSGSDSSLGFAPGSQWLNTTTLQLYECTSAAFGTAT